MNPRIDYHDPAFQFPPHYAIIAEHCVRHVVSSDESNPETVIALDIKAITSMLVHHMGQFERAGGNLTIDGYTLPAKVAARFYIDAICSVLGNHGVASNLQKIRQELCTSCIGSHAAAREFVADPPPAIVPDEVKSPPQEPGSATIIPRSSP